MEKLMNRLVAHPKLLEDEKLNSKIEKFFDNQTFQKIVESTDVFQELSFSNSFLQKKNFQAPNTENTVNSWDTENSPKFNSRGNKNPKPATVNNSSN